MVYVIGWPFAFFGKPVKLYCQLVAFVTVWL